MFLAQYLLNSSNIYLNATNLSVRYRSCRVLASSKDIMVFVKTRRLKLILAENIGWSASTLKSRLNFKNICQASPLHMRYQKSKKLCFCNFSKVRVSIITTYLLRQLFDQWHNFIVSAIQNRCNHIICKKFCLYVNGLFFVTHSLLWSRV